MKKKYFHIEKWNIASRLMNFSVLQFNLISEQLILSCTWELYTILRVTLFKTDLENIQDRGKKNSVLGVNFHVMLIEISLILTKWKILISSRFTFKFLFCLLNIWWQRTSYMILLNVKDLHILKFIPIL